MSDKFIEVEHLRQYFPAGGHGKHKKYIQAVDDVSFSINRGETLGLDAVRLPRVVHCCVCISQQADVLHMTETLYLM